MDGFENAVRRWDVRAFLRQQGFEVRTTVSRQAVIKCPRPSCRDHKFRLYISLQTKLSICHNCGWSANATNLVRLILHCDWLEASKVILSGLAASAPDVKPSSEAPEEVKLPAEFRRLKLPIEDRAQRFWEYLTERGLPPSLIMRYQLGYCRTGKYRHRIVVPIQMYGDLRGFVARATGDASRKYLNPTIKIGELLFNLDALIGQEEVVLVEGVFDALRLPEAAIATLGNKISREQVDVLVEAGFRRLIFCYDADALTRAMHHGPRIPEHVEVAVARLPAGYDPGNAPMPVLYRALRDAQPISLLDRVEARL